ncbi:2-dehydro-3-deoxygluconokinase [Roseivivax halodurans JCM 10272]|uniref:2-dehydro-3-deoxygluconokinase n=1 Tax=Roseivivax halodurans JCM 10272 TaxID=1449350 RepID=X7EI60_9RHOB|nr:sugar kinase [Roseivivax halodurans]ETX15607.1 2-dehydro-3-deoxygluconokinase [Roseivivax halodurans JCM 10272]
MTRSFLAIGECMVEMAQSDGGLYRRGFAGDTFNTAWYARRLLSDDWRVGYGSVIGEDAISGEMADFMAAEGLETDALATHAERTVGLYMISLDQGERSFSYWRSHSAARTLGDDPARLEAMVTGRDVIHVSGITLAILPPEGRARLCAMLDRARADGSTVSFDTNLRPKLWKSAEAMRSGLTAGAAAADVVLPSFDEDSVLFGDAVPDDTVARYRERGARCVAVKDGAGALTLWAEDEGRVVLEPEPVEPVDTTAAGDSFAAAFLAARAEGASLEEAGRAAMRLAARVIQSPGALVPGIFDDLAKT